MSGDKHVTFSALFSLAVRPIGTMEVQLLRKQLVAVRFRYWARSMVCRKEILLTKNRATGSIPASSVMAAQRSKKPNTFYILFSYYYLPPWHSGSARSW